MKYGCLFAILLVACSSSEDPGNDNDPTDADPVTDEAETDQDNTVITDDEPITYPECSNATVETCGPTATTLPAAGELGSNGTYTVVIETFDNPEPAPEKVSVYRPAGQTNVPVVFFSHAFGATAVAVYDLLLKNLASNGIAVVYVPYSTLGTSANNKRYTQLWSGFTQAAANYSDVFDLTRVAFIGHSFGGGATPEMARRAFVDEGWGSQGRFLFIMAPWYSWGSGYDTIPIDTRVVVQVYADDPTNDHLTAVNDIWNKLPAGIDKVWQVISSDVCDCGLIAHHTTPLSTPTSDEAKRWFNNSDAWGVQRRIVAMAHYTFDGDTSARAIAYGEDTSMGNWIGCEGRPVRPLSASTTPETHACHDYEFPYSNRCNYADDDYVCP